jgi:hypothetical protein
LRGPIITHIWGLSPADLEIQESVLKLYHVLNFGSPKEFNLQIKRMNPKRLQKEARREMEKINKTTRPSTLVQDYMREELETKKKEKRHRSSAEKQAHKDEQFIIRQQKKNTEGIRFRDAY